MGSLLLPTLHSKAEVDHAIRSTEDRVLVLRFGRETDTVCLQLDDVLARTQDALRKMAEIYLVDVDSVPVYVKYFDITLIPSTVFFFNGQHLKCDYGTPDHTKFVGCFQIKQDFIDLVEMFYRGASRGKIMINSPIPSHRIYHYELLYKDI